MFIDQLLHDSITEKVYSHATTATLLPGDVARLEIAINNRINFHHTNACMARLAKDAKLAAYHDREYEEYCHLYERILGKSPMAE